MSFSFDRCSCGRFNIHGATCVCESEPRHDGAVGDARKRAVADHCAHGDAAPAPAPEGSETLDLPSYEGACPKCGEYKFIGHGPLCVDCWTADPAPVPDEGIRLRERMRADLAASEGVPPHKRRYMPAIHDMATPGDEAEVEALAAEIRRRMRRYPDLNTPRGVALDILAAGYVSPEAHAAALAEAERSTAERIAEAIEARIAAEPVLMHVTDWRDAMELSARIAREAVE